MQFAVGGFSLLLQWNGNAEQCALDLSVCINDPFVDFSQELLNNELKNPARKVSLTVCGNL